MKEPSCVADVLDLVTGEPGRPRLTWYGPQGERIELSGAVLANWVAKTTNLLVEEFDAGPDVQVGIDLPAHWRTVVWSLAAWRAGSGVVLESGRVAAAAVVVTDTPASYPGAQALVAVALPALARRFDGDLPAGAVDAAGAVMTYADQIGWVPEIVTDRPAVGSVHHGELIAWARAGSDAPAGSRVLLVAGPDRSGDVETVLRAALGIWAQNGSVVLIDSALAAELTADPGRRERLAASERVTVGA